MRFILIDRITDWKPGSSAEATKNVTLSEDFFDDHFPMMPIMPGALILEGIAEIAGLLLEETVRRQQGVSLKAFLTLIERAKFRDFVKPGDSLTYRVKLESINEAGGRTSAGIWRGDRQIGEAQLMFAFRPVDNPVLEARRKEILDFWLRRADV